MEYLDFKGISKYDFYQKTGISNGVLSQKNGFSEENLLRFLNYFGEISPEWLITGNGDMLRTQNSQHTPGNSLQSSENQCKNTKNKAITQEKSINIDHLPDVGKMIPAQAGEGIPLIPIEALAGLPSVDNMGVTFLDCEHYIVPDFINKGAEYLIRVSGSSMYPKYSNGDILACRRIADILFFQWGKIYVIDSSQGALVKRIFEDTNNPDYIILVSDNKDKYPPFSFPKSDIRSLSIVIGVIRLE